MSPVVGAESDPLPATDRAVAREVPLTFDRAF